MNQRVLAFTHSARQMSGARVTDNGIDGLLAETRRRAARIDHYLDLIPARFYLGSEGSQGDSRSSLDPARAKSTSRLIMEAAAAEGKAASGASGSSQGRNKRRKASASPARDPKPSGANSRADLHEKLERRIAELREERKRRQTDAAEKARAAAATAAEAKGGGSAGGSSMKGPRQSPGEGRGRGTTDEDDGPEAGRLSFEAAAADLPFEAGVGRRGKKVRKLRAELRKQEVDAIRLREAESRGEGEALRKELALRKAMQRARGEKVHDDTSKLRKVQKAMEIKKKKGKDKWTAKLESDKQKVDEQQAQRRDNLKNRGSKKKAKRSGFEGKRTGYLNSEK